MFDRGQPGAGLAVGHHSTAVSQAGQRLNRRIHQPMTGLIIQLRDQAEAATVSLDSGRYRPVVDGPDVVTKISNRL